MAREVGADEWVAASCTRGATDAAGTPIYTAAPLRADAPRSFTRASVSWAPLSEAPRSLISELLEYARSLGNRVDDVVSLMRSI